MSTACPDCGHPSPGVHNDGCRRFVGSDDALPDCLLCTAYHRNGFGVGACARVLLGDPSCVNGDQYRVANPIRLYQREDRCPAT